MAALFGANLISAPNFSQGTKSNSRLIQRFFFRKIPATDSEVDSDHIRNRLCQILPLMQESESHLFCFCSEVFSTFIDYMTIMKKLPLTYIFCSWTTT